jgi:glycosyltransferase involved in cell wall biosynthesis
MPKISAVIIALNEETHIGRCIQSLQGVADEVLVIDSASTDHTKEIATSLGAKVLPLTWEGYAKTKNHANASAEYDYILSIDADEVLTKELRESILNIKDQLQGAYSFNRLNNYYGSFLKHGGTYPDSKIRLFDKRTASWQGDVHERLVLASGTAATTLKGDLEHYTCEDIRDHLNTIKKYSALAAGEMYKKGRSFSFLKLTIGAQLRFQSIYFFRLGFLDGIPGLLYAVMSAYAVFLRQAMLWELHKKQKRA